MRSVIAWNCTRMEKFVFKLSWYDPDVIPTTNSPWVQIWLLLPVLDIRLINKPCLQLIDRHLEYLLA